MVNDVVDMKEYRIKAISYDKTCIMHIIVKVTWYYS